MSRVAVPPPASDSLVRSVMETRTRDDGSSEVVAVEQYVAVDGEWVNVREMIDVWRRFAPLVNAQGRYLDGLRVRS